MIAAGGTSAENAQESESSFAASAAGCAPPKPSPQRDKNAASAAKNPAMEEIACAMELHAVLPTGSLDGQKVKSEPDSFKFHSNL